LGSEHSRKSDDGKERQIERGLNLKNQYGLTGGWNSWKLKHKKRKAMEEKKKKKNILIRILEWISLGNRKAVEKGTICRS
jgi:hypothetical protein